MNQDNAHAKKSYTLSVVNAAHAKQSYALPAVEAAAADRATGAEPTASWLRTASRRVWPALSAIWAAVIGLLPHVLRRAGLLAGAALFAGGTSAPGLSSPPASSHEAHHD